MLRLNMRILFVVLAVPLLLVPLCSSLWAAWRSRLRVRSAWYRTRQRRNFQAIGRMRDGRRAGAPGSTVTVARASWPRTLPRRFRHSI